MAEELKILSGTKEEIYQGLLPQIEALVQGEDNLVANLSNISAALKEAFNHLWIGFYISDGKELILGPFQGPVACTRIPFGKGVCGKAFSDNQSLVVPNVDEFPGHIACSSKSRSEIVIPIKDPQGNPKMVIDIDSEKLAAFDDTDKEYLEKLAKIIQELL